MQGIIRKRRCIKRTRGLRVATFTCLSLILLNSCSRTNIDKSSPYIERENKFAQKVCLDSSGRGRAKFGEEINRFTYQAAIKKGHFVLAIDIPFKTQETLELPLDDKAQLGGSLHQKTAEKLIRERKFKKMESFNIFLNSVSKLFAKISRLKSGNCIQQQCLPGLSSTDSDNYILKNKINSRLVLESTFKGIKSGHFKYLGVKVFNKATKSYLSFSLELITDECN